ncbi:Ff.00g022070.m01.CDS01 [Fusarium sp. VM40]|nr:Ff.00g022070.m01.CDS01 [Fusarium sp. VM40]
MSTPSSMSMKLKNPTGAIAETISRRRDEYARRQSSDELPAVQSSIPEKLVKAYVNHHGRAAPNELYTVDAITNHSIDTDDYTVEFETFPKWSTPIGNAFSSLNQTVIVRFPLDLEDLKRSNHAFKRYKRAMRPINGVRRKGAGWEHLVTAHQYAYHRMLVELRFERHAFERAMRRNEAVDTFEEGDQVTT